MSMFIHFFCLCPLGLTINLNFNITKSGLFALSLDFMESAAIFEYFPGFYCYKYTNCRIFKRLTRDFLGLSDRQGEAMHFSYFFHLYIKRRSGAT